ncbi:efflux RND transporter periplasmic adaptor subunit [Poriferisphaera sp. WC338]|uniref:efflux RND transporter periplasmic adaptor subunit n=1 Tax=Poriferisphaera sp. WC338 TaxID=3425129 RepID=UPI003D819EF7
MNEQTPPVPEPENNHNTSSSTKPHKKGRIPAKWVGPLIGISFVTVAILALLFFNPKPKPEPRQQAIRPAKLLTLGSPTEANIVNFPGRVKAGQSVDLAFQVTGQIIELPIKQGDEVKQGDLIAQLDPRDFQNNVAKAQATLTEKQTILDQIRQLVERNAATNVELTNALAAQQIAMAQLQIEQKALDDTTLRAPFAGLVARKYVDNFQNIQAKQTIISLQNVSDVEIIVDIPEAIVAKSQRDEQPPRIDATFDFLPGRTFPLTMKEYQSEANPITQTYEVTLTMPAPKDVLILPGMSASVDVYPTDETQSDLGFAVPIAAVFKEKDQSYVWLVNPDNNEVSKQPVTVGKLSDQNAIITEGLSSGNTIVTSGASQLNPGQMIRPFNAKEYGP